MDNRLPVMTILGEMLNEAEPHVLPGSSGTEAVRVPGGFDLLLCDLA